MSVLPPAVSVKLLRWGHTLMFCSLVHIQLHGGWRGGDKTKHQSQIFLKCIAKLLFDAEWRFTFPLFKDWNDELQSDCWYLHPDHHQIPGKFMNVYSGSLFFSFQALNVLSELKSEATAQIQHITCKINMWNQDFWSRVAALVCMYLVCKFRKTKDFKIMMWHKLNEAAFVCQVTSTHPECSIVLHLRGKETECKLKINAAASRSSSNTTAGRLQRQIKL